MKLSQLLEDKRRLADCGIEVTTGDDGSWIYLKTKSGQQLAFQPIQVFGPLDPFRPTILEWCKDQQAIYDSAMTKEKK